MSKAGGAGTSSDEQEADLMNFIEKRPPWFARFARLIERSWAHHGPCGNLHVSCAFDNDSGEWVIVAAPVFQEVLGGEDDGKTVWTGFVFQPDKLLRAMAVESISTASVCQQCCPTPTVVIRGRYRGHRVHLKVLLEPVPGSSVIEIIDMLKHEIRDLPKGSAQ
jgi:hypothetical protein